MMMDENQSMEISFPIQDAFLISQNDSKIQEIVGKETEKEEAARTYSTNSNSRR